MDFMRFALLFSLYFLVIVQRDGVGVLQEISSHKNRMDSLRKACLLGANMPRVTLFTVYFQAAFIENSNICTLQKDFRK